MADELPGGSARDGGGGAPASSTVFREAPRRRSSNGGLKFVVGNCRGGRVGGFYFCGGWVRSGVFLFASVSGGWNLQGCYDVTVVGVMEI